MDPVTINLISALTKSIVDTWLTPKLKEMLEKREIDKNFYNEVSDKFAAYLKEIYSSQHIMNTIVFKNQQKTIDELYIPLHLNKVMNNGEDFECIKVDSYKKEFIERYKKIIITDTAGMGKSTVMKWLFINAIRQHEGIPIFIELRKLSRENTIINEIFKNINSIDNQFNEKYILSLLKRGDFIFFFDGYDEIATNDKAKVTEDLQWFISKASENVFIMSSREERALVSFGDFQRFNIKPLDKNEAYDLISKYDNGGELSAELNKKIESDKNLSLLSEFLINPLMTSLLYKAYEYKKVIPYKKSLFYRQVYDALFEVHDFSKGGVFVHDKESKLDMDDFEEVIKYISYKSFVRGKTIYQREELIGLIKEAKEKNTRIQFKETAYLEDLIKNVPLFIKDGVEYRWTHKSFQEYFAAKYICHNIKDKQKDVLLSMAKSSKNDIYYNVLDFCYDIDYTTFRRTIILNLISSFMDHYNNRQLFIDMKIDNADISERKMLTFSKRLFFYRYKTNDIEINRNITHEVLNRIKKDIGHFVTILTAKEYLIGYSNLPNYNIIKLLRNKGESFIIKSNSKHNYIQIEYFTGIVKDKLILIDESEENVFNYKENFTIGNSIIYDFLIYEGDPHENLYTLDLKECMKLKTLIEKELESEKFEDDDF
jgi:hypothetical protein